MENLLEPSRYELNQEVAAIRMVCDLIREDEEEKGPYNSFTQIIKFENKVCEISHGLLELGQGRF